MYLACMVAVAMPQKVTTGSSDEQLCDKPYCVPFCAIDKFESVSIDKGFFIKNVV